MVEAKKAAACIIMDAEDRILMVRRSPKLRFMPGHHAFPGGRVSESESTAHVIGTDDPALARSVMAAAREVFEETGLLLAEGAVPEAEARRRARQDLLEDKAEFDEILAAFDVRIDAGRFEEVAHWITPRFSPIRFDTLYFLFRHGGEQKAELIEGELVGLDWMHASEARRRWHKGEIHVSTPVACTLQPMAARPYPDFVPLVRRITQSTPGHPNRFELRRGIHIIPLRAQALPPATHTNCVIIGEDEYLLIDPGSDEPGELESLCDQIDQLAEMGARMRAIVLTHSHPDHVAGVSHVRERYGAPVWAHDATAAQVKFGVDRRLAEGDVIELPGDPGWRVHIMHTPGHDPGHVCLFEETTRTLAAGDMVANPGTIVVSEQYGGNMNQFIASLERLMNFEGPRLIIPSHGGPVGRADDIFRKQRDHRLWRENKIHEAYKAGHTDFRALLAAAYDDAKPEALPLAEHALRAHLSRLGLRPEE
jgi:glyoxylase-like metal-dependent hydrolase (beta-lactamase superfamily II)/8-oxo-dGTP pyrophosphatase MutT (NUDIX family)